MMKAAKNGQLRKRGHVKMHPSFEADRFVCAHVLVSFLFQLDRNG